MGVSNLLLFTFIFILALYSLDIDRAIKCSEYPSKAI